MNSLLRTFMVKMWRLCSCVVRKPLIIDDTYIGADAILTGHLYYLGGYRVAAVARKGFTNALLVMVTDSQNVIVIPEELPVP
jgi:hypothetical protein